MNQKHGIIGCGRIAPSHINACLYNNIPVGSCFDLDHNKAIEFADKYQITHVSASLEEILQDKSITSVSVCTDHLSHGNLTIQCLKAGKHVIVEKPMALTVEKGQEMIDTAKDTNKVLSVISQHRYNPLAQEIKKTVQSSVFGKITLINATLNCQRDNNYYTESDWKGTKAKEGGSTLINQAIHTLDQVLWMHGLPNEFKSFGSNLKFKGIIETEDTFVGLMKFSDESLAVISSTNTSTDIWDSKVEIIGTKGTVIFSTGFPFEIIKLIHQDPGIEQSLKELFASKSEKISIPIPLNYYNTTHCQQMADFFNVISGKYKKLYMSPSEALQTLSVVLEFYKYN